MDTRRRLVSAAILVVIGGVTISRFTAGVRDVAVVGLVAGGFALGVALGLLVTMRSRNAA